VSSGLTGQDLNLVLFAFSLFFGKGALSVALGKPATATFLSNFSDNSQNLHNTQLG
jgi:hypothetical protein